MQDSDVDLAMGAFRQQMAALRQMYGQDEFKRLQKWEDEKAMLQTFVSALEQTQGLIRGEIQRLQEVVKVLRSDTVDDEAKLEQALRPHHQGPEGGGGGDGDADAAAAADKDDDDSIQAALRRIGELGAEKDRLCAAMERVNEQGRLAKGRYKDPATSGKEREVWEAQIITLQDTRRMYIAEIDRTDQDMHALDRFVHVERQRRKAQVSGWDDLLRLQQQLTATEAKVDRAKQKLYFPEVKGYRFAAGSNKVYTGARDLYISEISGSFVLSAQSVGRSADGEPVARFVLSLGGASVLQPLPRKQRPTATAGSEAKAERAAPDEDLANGPDQQAGCGQPPASGPDPPSRSAAAAAGEARAGEGASQETAQISPQPVPDDAGADKPGSRCGGASAAPPLRAASAELDVSTESHSSSVMLDDHANEAGGEMTGGSGLRPGMLRRGPGLKGRLNNFAVKLSSKARAPIKDRFQSVKGTGGGEGPEGVADAADGSGEQPGAEGPGGQTGGGAGGRLGRKLAASFMASKAGGLAPRRPRQASQEAKRVQDLRSLAASISQRAAAEAKANSNGVLQAGDGDVVDSSGLPEGDGTDGSGQSLIAEPGPDAEAASKLQGGGEHPGDADASESETSEGDLAEEDIGRNSSFMSADGTEASSGDPGGEETQDAAGPVSEPISPGSRAEAFKAPAANAGPSARPAAASASSSKRRRGVYIRLRGEDMGLVGEKGSKVPNATVKEISLEVECVLSIQLEYNRMKGWQASKPVEFEVLSLHHTVKGSSVPIPKTLLKGSLNLVLPKVVKRSILPAVPKEWGEYLLDSCAGMKIKGEVLVQGPPLEALTADLGLLRSTDEDAPGSAENQPQSRIYGLGRRRRRGAAGLPAAANGASSTAAAAANLQTAVGMLHIDAVHAAVLAELFANRMAIDEKGQLLAPAKRPASFSVIDLCRFYTTYRCYPRLWGDISSIFGRALHVLLGSWGVVEPLIPQDFGRWMDDMLGPLVKKQVSVQFALHDVDVCLDCDVGLNQAADYFRRTLAELHEKGSAAATNGPERMTLDEALANIDTWEQGLKERIQGFKGRFREMEGTMVASADNKSFAIGLDTLKYIGPLSLKVPVDGAIDADGALSFDVKIPKRKLQLLPVVRGADGKAYIKSDILEKVKHRAGVGVFMSGPSASSTASSVQEPQDATAEASTEEWENSPRHLASLLRPPWSSPEKSDTPHEAVGKVGEGNDKSSMQPGRLAPEYLARLVVNRLGWRMEPDESALSDMFISQDAGLAATTLTAMLKDMFSMHFKPAFDHAAGRERYLLQLETGKLCRAVMEATSLGLQSPLSPAEASLMMYTAAREAMVAFGHKGIEAADETFKTVHDALDREALSMCCCLLARAEAYKDGVGSDSFTSASNANGTAPAQRWQQHQRHRLRLQLAGGTGSDGVMPLYLTNEVDLVTIVEAIVEAPEIGM